MIVVLLHTCLDSSFKNQILPLIEDLTNSIRSLRLTAYKSFAHWMLGLKIWQTFRQIA
jgi:hypothetical protein